MTQIGLTAIPSNIALVINTIGDVGNQMTKNKLPKANKNPSVKTSLVPKRLSKKPMTKFVVASAITVSYTHLTLPTNREV